MKRSLFGSHGLARLVVLGVINATIFFSVSTSDLRVTQAVAPTTKTNNSTSAAIYNDQDFRSSAVTGNFTLNKYVYPGNAVFSSLNPSLVTNSSPITSNWPIGVPLLYVITIGNSNLNQTNLMDITLKDDLANSLGPNFVLLSATCDPFNGAVCPTMPSPGTPLPLSISGLKVKVGSSNDLVIRLWGYYTAPNTYQNTFSVFETGNQASTEEQGPPKNVQITGNWSALDLGLTKTSSTNSTAVSTTSPATIHYKLVLTGDASHDFYPQNLLQIQDQLSDGYPPLPGYSISSFTCSSINGSTCPAPPSPAMPGTSISSGNSYAYSYLVWPSGTSTVIKKGDTVTIEFDVSVSESACGSSSITIQNAAAIQVIGFIYADSDNTNNSAATTNTFTTGLQVCPPPQTPGSITKTRVCPASGCPTLNWGDTVTYQIVVKNNLTTVQAFQVRDYISKQSITIPLRAKLVPNTSATDVHCTPATVVCTTTPDTTLPPFVKDVLLDTVGYLFFNTDFTLQPTGAVGDTVTITFDVLIDKLADCETDVGNHFLNSANLYAVSSSSSILAGYTPSLTVQFPNLSPCNLRVTKTLTSPGAGITFGQQISYAVAFENLSSQTVTVRTLRDALNMRDLTGPNAYGNIPITNLTVNCTPINGVSPMPSIQTSYTQISPSSADWSGTAVIYESNQATGITFPGNSKLQCTVSFVPHAPSSTDNFCQGQGQPEVLNNAFMDVSGLQTWSTSTAPVAPYFAQVISPLPFCRKVSVLKTIGNGVASTGPNGLLTFQINVTNHGNGPVSNFVLNDPLPLGFTSTGPITCSACQSANFSGSSPQVLNAVFNPIPGTNQAPNNTVTLSFQVNASSAGGTYSNTATGSFSPGNAGSNFYFEGDPNVLLVNSAQVQVLTPTLTKTIAPGNIAANGSAVLTFTITNQTSDPPQTGVSFTDTLPTGLTVTSAPSTACGGTLTVTGGNTIALANGTMPQGLHQCQVVLNVKGILCGTFVNNQSNFTQVKNLDVTSANATLTVEGNCPTEPTEPTLTKEFKPATVSQNGTTTLGFTITNSTGDPKQTGISFSDTLPAGLQIVTVTSNNCGGNVGISSDGRTLTLTGGQLVGPNSDGSGNHACQIFVQVRAVGECGVYRNRKDNFSNVTNIDVSGIDSQLEVVDCKPATELCEVKTNDISCKADGAGGYLYTFTVTNNTGQLVTDILLTPPAGSNLTLSQNQFPLLPNGLAAGSSITLQVTIKGGKPQEQACFDVTLMTKDGECCTRRVCPVLPECCGVAKDESIECNGDGTFTYVLTITNTGLNTLEHIYLYPPAGVTMTPNYFAVSLAPGQTFTTKIIITGAKPGDKLCFDISLHTEGMKDCCKGRHCIVLPECAIKKPSR